MQTTTPLVERMNGTDAGATVQELTIHVNLIQELVRVSNCLRAFIASDQQEALRDGLTLRAELVTRLNQSGKGLKETFRNSPCQSNIETALKPFYQELADANHQLVAKVVEKKQAVAFHLAQMQQQKKLMNYLR